ncbi:MAG TPA: hypothetical protein VMM35_08680 [Longimicrobiales bacterium]|nr:hypothetical protein [Longimicrobiales bacterium]
MRSTYVFVGLAALAVLGPAGSVHAQSATSRPRVFFDCNGPNCNSQYYRTEINWVNWVNDPGVADLHIIMGSLNTGAGGREYQIDFIGVESEEGYEDQHHYNQLATDTQRESLDGITHTLGLGIANWANTNGYRGLVRLRGPNPELGEEATRRVVSQEEVEDPWNLWVFRINANGNRSSEDTRTTTRFNGGFNASRVSPTWKMSFNVFANHRRERRELTTGLFNTIETDWNFNQLVAYSIADHWSVGITGRVGRQHQFNREERLELQPTIEYSFFPYEEATRRSLTAFYSIGPQYNHYFERTVLGEKYETLYEHSIDISFNSRQTWGDAGFSIRASHYLHDFDLYNRSIRGDINYRIARGISVFARGDVAWVQDQIYLSAAGATDEEALLDLRRRATDRESSLSIGLQFQFGSIFNNVVNNRFRGIRGFGGGGGGF